MTGRSGLSSVEEFVEHVLYRGLCLIRSCVAHVVVLKSGLDDLNARFLANLFSEESLLVGLELRILRTE